jgi:hypothetical protein
VARRQRGEHEQVTHESIEEDRPIDQRIRSICTRGRVAEDWTMQYVISSSFN